MHFALIDADLLDNGTRHPNLVLLKIAGYLRDHGFSYHLVIDSNENLEQYDYVYESRVFAFTKEPECVERLKTNTPKHILNNKYHFGGTGFYVLLEDPIEFKRKREEDMIKLERDKLFVDFELASQMPDYNLYVPFVNKMIASGKKEKRYKDYLNYSIGFLTRGCIRHCPFCVNKNETKVFPYSKLNDFWDKTRSYIYLWDDNFLAAPYHIWRPLLEELIATGRPFQFRQGLDIRLLTEEKAELLSKARYHGDMIFAFDQWKDREMVEKHLKIWKSHCPQKTTKLYLFCGFELTVDSDDKIFWDIYYLFRRIEILMQYGCLGYVMRHEDYKNHPLANIYVQIARWCNQPQFYKKMTFREFIDRNQFHTKTDKDCQSVRAYKAFIAKFKDKIINDDSGYRHVEELFENIRYTELYNPSLWNN